MSKTATAKKPDPSEAPAPVENVLCGSCGKATPKDPETLCAGCDSYLCNECAASPPFGKHEPWKHKPCDTCGESVTEKGFHLCQGCLDGEEDE